MKLDRSRGRRLARPVPAAGHADLITVVHAWRPRMGEHQQRRQNDGVDIAARHRQGPGGVVRPEQVEVRSGCVLGIERQQGFQGATVFDRVTGGTIG